MHTLTIWAFLAFHTARLAALDAAIERQRYHREVLHEGEPQPPRDPCGYRAAGVDPYRISVLLQLPDCIPIPSRRR